MNEQIVGQPLTKRCARADCDHFVTRQTKPSRQAKGYDRYCSRRCARLDQRPLSQETRDRRSRNIWVTRRANGTDHLARPLRERFLEKISPEPNTGCWLWTGTVLPFGHGLIGRGGRGTGMARAHRVAWELFRGPIPTGLQVCHRCDVPCCVNPDHLFLGTQRDNITDMINKGRRRADRRWVSKLTPEQVGEIKRRLATGERCCDLAPMFGVSDETISAIRRGHSWNDTPAVVEEASHD
jgi:hypothetical protein